MKSLEQTQSESAQAHREGSIRGGETTRRKHLESDEFKQKYETVKEMREKGYSLQAIANTIGINKRNTLKFVSKHGL